MLKILQARAMLSKSLIQLSVGGWGCVPSLLFYLRPNYGGGNEYNDDPFKRSHAGTATLSAPNLAAGHCIPTPLPETPGHSWASVGQSLVGSLLLSPGSQSTQGSVCALQESVFPVLCKFWWLSGGVNCNLLQEGLCHTQIYCTQSPCPWSSPLLTGTSTGDIHTQFWLSFWGGVWCAQDLFEPLWRIRGLILIVILPFLPSCWCFSFAPGNEVSFFSGIQNFTIDGFSATRCNFGVLTGEDECMSFNSTISEKRPLVVFVSQEQDWLTPRKLMQAYLAPKVGLRLPTDHYHLIIIVISLPICAMMA